MPITIAVVPLANFACTSRFAAAVIEPVNNSTEVAISPACKVPESANSPSNFFIVLKCCCARTSVGANIAAWPPESTTDNMARKATTVLPDPTSPCSKRCIGYLFERSFSISAFTNSWPGVYLKGNLSSKALTKTGVFGVRLFVLILIISARRCPSNNCSSSASSKVKRALACSALINSFG